MKKIELTDNDANKPCLKCTVKHLLNAKTFMMESLQFGADFNVTVEELNQVILKLATYILDKKGAANGK